MKQAIAAAALAGLLLTPAFASASFYQSAETARSQAAGLSQQQLDSLNSKVFVDAFVAARIVGFDRSEIDQIKAQLHALQVENAQLRAQITVQPVSGGAISHEAIYSQVIDEETGEQKDGEKLDDSEYDKACAVCATEGGRLLRIPEIQERCRKLLNEYVTSHVVDSERAKASCSS